MSRRWLLRWPSVVTALAAMLWLNSPALACTVCYGSNESSSPLLLGARQGVFLLLGITVLLLAAFARFFFYLRNRARQVAGYPAAAECTHLERSASL